MTSDPSTVITSLSGTVLVDRYLAAGQRLAQEPRYHTGGVTVDALAAAALDGWALSDGDGDGLTAVRAAALAQPQAERQSFREFAAVREQVEALLVDRLDNWHGLMHRPGAAAEVARRALADAGLVPSAAIVAVPSGRERLGLTHNLRHTAA